MHASIYTHKHTHIQTCVPVCRTKDELDRNTLQGVTAVFLGAPTQKFEASELNVLHEYMANGGNVCVMVSEAESTDANANTHNFTHLNKLTQDYGIIINNDSVVRTVYHKDCFHPKEAYIPNCALTTEVSISVCIGIHTAVDVQTCGYMWM